MYRDTQSQTMTVQLEHDPDRYQQLRRHLRADDLAEIEPVADQLTQQLWATSPVVLASPDLEAPPEELEIGFAETDYLDADVMQQSNVVTPTVWLSWSGSYPMSFATTDPELPAYVDCTVYVRTHAMIGAHDSSGSVKAVVRADETSNEQD